MLIRSRRPKVFLETLKPVKLSLSTLTRFSEDVVPFHIVRYIVDDEVSAEEMSTSACSI
ncbi:hypothetical protein CES86_1685 [Brucella lupini]|uniref:Uncharacterized protein n=1 Tax=Brucella lupini TaxID=255457 RepID=A0A256GUX4_9HYPH|nr:hypothetical protein CES86_1685 [Brucella lupini]